jgi:hypothetical protein
MNSPTGSGALNLRLRGGPALRGALRPAHQPEPVGAPTRPVHPSTASRFSGGRAVGLQAAARVGGTNYGTKEITVSASNFLARNDHTGRVGYDLPNGIWVSVIPDPQRPLHWELLAEYGRREPVVIDGLDGGGLAGGLTTAEAEELLERLAALIRGGEPGHGKQSTPIPAQ